jgi:hypothetical protein
MAVDSIELGRNPNLAPCCRRAAPPHLPPNRSLVEHRRNSAVPLECTPSRASHQGGPSTTENRKGEAPPSPALDVTHRFLLVSKTSSLHLYGSLGEDGTRKRTTVARDRRNSDELRQPAREHRRPLSNLIYTVHHKPSG